MIYSKSDMFKLASQIDSVMNISGTSLEAKRRIITNYNGELFYIFGNKLESKPMLLYWGKNEY